MPSRSPFPILIDIKRNIDLAYTFVVGLSFEAFRADRRTVYAVTRCLEIISEAPRRLPTEVMARHTQIPWTDIAAAGNVYRHEYEEVLDAVIWRTVQHNLEPLRAVVELELGSFPQRDE
jgi:uncharacterized protein with HEPN domain